MRRLRMTRRNVRMADPRWPAFCHWLEARGGKLRGIVLRTSSRTGTRGLFATRDIARGTSVAYIPAAAMLGSPNPRHSWLPWGDGNDSSLANLACLTYTVLSEHADPCSPFKPYLDLLEMAPGQAPEPGTPSLVNSLMLPPAAVRAMTRGSYMEYVHQNLEERFRDVCRLLSGHPGTDPHLLTGPELLWAFGVVNSRYFGTHMIPVADAMNMGGEENMRVVQIGGAARERRVGTELVASRDIVAGEELLNSYESTNVPTPDSVLLCQYGFTMVRNRTNFIDVDVPVPREGVTTDFLGPRCAECTLVATEKRAVGCEDLSAESPAACPADLEFGGDGEADAAHLPFLLSARGRLPCRFLPAVAGTIGASPGSAEARGRARDLLSARLLRYPTTLSADLEWLDRFEASAVGGGRKLLFAELWGGTETVGLDVYPHLGEWCKAAMGVRIEEKVVLHRAIKLLRDTGEAG